MKKINKLIMMGALGLIFAPGIANAASLSFGTSTKDDNRTIVPIYLEIEENDQFNQVKLNCETNNDSVGCEIEKADGGTAISSETSSAIISNIEGNFDAGKVNIANVVLTNTGESKQTGVVLTVSNISLQKDGTEVTKLDSAKREGIEVKEKAVEKQTTSDARLSNVEFSQGNMSPEFSSDTYEYVIYGISDTINSIKLKLYTCNDGTECSINVSGGTSTSNKTVYLARGENDVKVTVISSDGTKNLTYKFKVYRGQTGYNSAKLSSLSFGEYTLTPVFDKDTTEYTLTVPNKINTVDTVIQYTAEDSTLPEENITKEGTDNLSVGENTLKITVKNANGDDTTVYVVKVIRQEDKQIKILSYKDKIIVFYNESGSKTELSEDDFKTQYNEEWLKIANKEYKFDEDGNLIESSDSDDTTETKEEKEKSKLWIIILLILGGLVIIVLSGIFIFKKKPEDKKKDVKKDEIDETGIEEEAILNENKEPGEETVNIDEALSDLLDTKSYDFNEKE